MSLKRAVVLQGVQGPDRFIEDVRRIEQLGYEHLWLTDSSLHTRSPWSYLALAATNSTRLTLGTAVTNPLTRNPAIVAVEAATIGEISNGRFTLGIGAGDRPLLALGLVPAKLVELEAAVGRIRSLLDGEHVPTPLASGPDNEAHLSFPPTDRVPIHISATGPRTLELAGRIADGVIVLCGLDPVAINWALERIDKGAQAVGRPRPNVSIFAYGAIDADIDQAMAAARPIAAWFPQTAPIYCDLLGLDEAIVHEVQSRYDGGEFQEAQTAANMIPDEFVEKVALCGDVAQAVERLSVLAETGIDSVSLFPLGDNRQQTIELFDHAWRKVFE